MDRIEMAIESMIRSQAHLLESQAGLEREQQRLLTAQVMLTDEVRTGFRELRDAVTSLASRTGQLTAAVAELRTSQALTDERFRALIDTLRNPPKN
jgi:hypothetical protein